MKKSHFAIAFGAVLVAGTAMKIMIKKHKQEEEMEKDFFPNEEGIPMQEENLDIKEGKEITIDLPEEGVKALNLHINNKLATTIVNVNLKKEKQE